MNNYIFANFLDRDKMIWTTLLVIEIICLPPKGTIKSVVMDGDHFRYAEDDENFIGFSAEKVTNNWVNPWRNIVPEPKAFKVWGEFAEYCEKQRVDEGKQDNFGKGIIK